MKFQKIIIVFVIIGVLFFLSGCGGPTNNDCKAKDTTYVKYTLDPDTGMCIPKTIPKNVCGNRIKENGETYCNCPSDVLKTDPVVGCSGTLGNYLVKECDNKTKTCKYFQNKKVIEETKQLDLKNSDIWLQGTFTFDKPFILNTANNDVIKIDLSLYNFPSSGEKISNLKVKSISIVDYSNVVYAHFDFNKDLTNIGDSLPEVDLKLSQTNSYDSRKNLNVKLTVQYTVNYLDRNEKIVKVENKIQTLTSSLGYLEIINPNLYVKPKTYR